MSDLEVFKDFVREVTQETGALIRRYWDGEELGLERKADDTPVTMADREAELLLRRAIAKRFPDHGIIGEEFPDVSVDAEYVWLLDPIDGTKSFVGHVPLFGTLIGLLHRGSPVLGVIHQPILGELLIGDNVCAELNGKPVGVRPCEALSEATMLTTDLALSQDPKIAEGMRRLMGECRVKRTWGDCYGYLLLATGRVDVMLDPILEKWDLLPLIPVIRGAGGVITSWTGEDPLTGRSAVATAPGLHDKVLSFLKT